ncbi:MAG: cytochrome-c peroxidase [bacterium]|nr:cytochrome-c peroxidase [bacterium]
MTLEGIELGKKLFFDPILSVDSTKACASCHNFQFAFTDPNTFSKGVAGFTRRNSMPLMNVAWMPALFWDGRAESLEAQALLPVEDKVEMGETWENVIEKLKRHPAYPDLFKQAFGDVPITSDLAVKAIAQFERTLISANAKWDRIQAGQATFTPQEKQGFDIFSSEKSECFHCHIPGMFTDNRFHNNGLQSTVADSGLAAVTENEFHLGQFKVPTLRNVEYTAPYMHDGRFQTLEDVIEFYDHSVQPSATLDPLMQNARKLNLTQAEKEALIAFLKTLSDPGFLNFTPP